MIKNSTLLYENNILLDKFTFKSSDYYKKDIINKYILLRCIKDKNAIMKIKKRKKIELFNELCIIIDDLKKYNIKKIIKIQSHIRRYFIYRIFKLRGPGVIKKSNNEEDFYYSTNKREISNIYYFSYKDEQDNIWMFDIRSINKLIQDPLKSKNPYTRIEIPSNIIKNIKVIISYLKKNKINTKLEHELIIYNTTQKMNDIIVNLSNNGYIIDKSWIDELNIVQFKKLYESFNDMWYYRLNLSNMNRYSILPEYNGLIFKTNYKSVNNMTDINQIKDLLFNDIYKLINTPNNDYKTLVSMWCIISFATVINKCNIYNDWINQVIN